jgi:hypothetical protein
VEVAYPKQCSGYELLVSSSATILQPVTFEDHKVVDGKLVLTSENVGVFKFFLLFNQVKSQLMTSLKYEVHVVNSNNPPVWGTPHKLLHIISVTINLSNEMLEDKLYMYESPELED